MTSATHTLTPNLEKIQERIRDWPKQPGVYFMRDSAKRILYVGKAKNLKNRIKSYFQNQGALEGKTRILMKKVSDIEFTVTHTELEALLLECNLIKKHRPRYNMRLKDDKNFPYVVLDFTHPFPQFRISRKVAVSPQLKYFGPFGAGVRDISRFLLKTFRIRDCGESKFRNRTRPCLNYEIGICTAPCVGYVTQEDYGKQLREATLFLKGKKRELVSDLKKEMTAASKDMRYEEAKMARDKILAIEKLTQEQDVVATDGVIDVDVVGCFVSGSEMQWVLLFLRGGVLTGRRALKINSPIETPEEATRSFLEQFYTTSLIPDEVWISNDFPDREDVERLLSLQAGRKVRISVKRGEKAMRLLGMAYENAKLIFQEATTRRAVSAAEQLKEVLGLAEAPNTIEGIDVSNFQGAQPAVAVVHFSDERPLKSQYRSYHPRTVEGQDDFAMIYEIVQRRFGNPETVHPDLLLIDGGKGQLSAAVRALKEVGADIAVCSLAKARTESGFTLKKVNKSEERIFLPERKNPIVLAEGHPALRLLQQVRDEAHRFSVKLHRARRTKHAQESQLLDLRGVGVKTKALLLTAFGSMEKIREASKEELIAAGMSKGRAAALHRSLRPELNGEE